MLSSSFLPAQSRLTAERRYGTLQMSFEVNQGQTDSRVRFLSHGDGYSLFLTDSEAVLSVQRKNKSDVVRMHLSGANPKPEVHGSEQLPGKANYFIGNDPTKWRRNVPTYSRVRYNEVYRGVDLVYYGNQGRLEYDFVIGPGADPDQIRLRFTGARQLRLGPDGRLFINGKEAQAIFGKPLVYQTADGRKRPVDGHFQRFGRDTVGFVLGRYDRRKSLVIDPTLAYSTYLGGTGFQPPAAPDCCGSTANGIAVDSYGSAYVVGTTGSTDFPVSATAFQTVNHDAFDQANGTAATVFVTKFDPTGSTLIYSTYLGGSTDYWYRDSGQAIAVDASGNAYITGYTGSSNFPVTPGAFQTVNKAAAAVARNAFVTKLTADGSGLIYSTYLGGSGFNTGVARDGDFATGIAIDSSGDAFVVGSSFSQDFPVTNGAFQTANRAWPIQQANPFVTKLNPSGTGLIYSTYLGGTGYSEGCCYYFSGADYGTGIAVDSFGDAFVTGYAHSKNFPVTPGAFQSLNLAHNSINGTGAVDTNAFVTKFNPSGTGLLYSTYVGGSGNQYYGDQAAGIAIDSDGFAYITGQTGSLDFPISPNPGGFETVAPMYYRPIGFVTKLKQDGSGLAYSTFLGGSGNYNHGDNASAIAVNSLGEAFITGTTISWDFPVTSDAFQLVNNQSTGAAGDYYSGNAFLTQLNSTGTGAVYSTYFGGSGAPSGGGGDVGLAVALDASGDPYIAGQTVSLNFPVTTGAYQLINRAAAAGRPGSAQAFVAEFGGLGLPLVPTGTTLTSNADPQVAGATVTFKANVSDLIGTTPSGTVTFKIDGIVASIVTLDSNGQAVYTTTTIPVGPHAIVAAYSGTAVFAPSSASLSETINANSVAVAFNTSPGGLGYSVDGTSYTSAQVLTLSVGSTHTISTTALQTAPGTRYSFSAWSDAGALSHSITISAAASYTAGFNTSYLLSTGATPTAGGSVSPASGTYYPAGTIVPLVATANNGYAFSSWTGNVANAANATTTVALSAPQNVAASFAPAGTAALFGNITGKSGPGSARVWSIQVSDNGPAAALGAQVSSISLVQVGGAACSPVATSSLPAAAGNLAPGASATVPLTIDFSSCAANARFTVTLTLSANAGNAIGSIVRLNQFQ
jgi:hypothetical protein